MVNDNKLMLFLDRMLRILLGFIKAQAIMFGLNWLIITLCLWLFGLGLGWSLLIALGISLLDLLPVIGSGIVFLPWIIICLASGESALGWRLALLYIGLVLLRQVVEPIITGKQVGIRPVIALLAAVAGVLALGPIGVVVGPVIAAVVKVVMEITAPRDAGNSSRPR